MNNPIAILNVSQSQLSIARHYGGANINGIEYRYFAKHDILVQSKHAKHYQRKSYKEFLEYIKNPNEKKEGNTEKPPASGKDTQVQQRLFPQE